MSRFGYGRNFAANQVVGTEGLMIEAAVCMAGGLPDLDRHFAEATLDFAAKRYPSGIGLRQLLNICAEANGVNPHRCSEPDLLTAAFGSPGVRASGFSTLSLPGILSNVANKFMMDGFNAVESTWKQIAKISAPRDFKTYVVYTLTGNMTYEKVGPGGELKHGSVGELGYSNQADSYGKMFTITRTHIINDDLGALTAVPKMLGRGSALAINNVFWTEFLDNSTFFTSGNGNLLTGSGSALSSDGLEAAATAYAVLTDPNGYPLGIEPKILLVPPQLRYTAETLVTSQNVNTGGSSTTDKVPNRNVWEGRYSVAMSSYISNPSYTGYSATQWFLLADPADLAAIDVGFLGGRQEPTVQAAEADFSVLGIQFRGHHDFGCRKQEYRSGIRNAGA